MSVEPIGRVLGPRTGIDGTAPVHETGPVTRDREREDPRKEGRRRPPAPKPPPAGGVSRDGDGHLHVDVQA